MSSDRATSNPASPSLGPVPVPAPAHVRRKVYALVQEVRHLQLYLQHHHYPDAAVRRQRSAVLNGLSWVLECVGYPPARYDEVLRDFAPVKVRERRTRTQAKDERPERSDPMTGMAQPADVPEKGWIR